LRYQEGTTLPTDDERRSHDVVYIPAAPKGIAEFVDSIAYHSYQHWTSCYTYVYSIR